MNYRTYYTVFQELNDVANIPCLGAMQRIYRNLAITRYHNANIAYHEYELVLHRKVKNLRKSNFHENRVSTCKFRQPVA